MSFSPAWRVLTWIGVSWYFSLHPHIALFKMESHFWFGQQMPCLRGKTHGLGQCDVDKDPPTNLISWYLWRSSEEQERWIKPLHIKITFYSNSLVVQWLRIWHCDYSSSGCCCGVDSIPGPGTSTSHMPQAQPKKKKKLHCIFTNTQTFPPPPPKKKTLAVPGNFQWRGLCAIYNSNNSQWVKQAVMILCPP